MGFGSGGAYPGSAWGSPTGAEHIPRLLAYEVRAWARGAGKTVRDVVWNNVMKCGEVRLALRPGDPRLKSHQEGRTRVDYEPVFLHRRTPDGKHLKAIPLEVDTVLAFLREMDVESGSGRWDSADAAAKEADKHNAALEESIKRAAGENARARARERKGRLFDLPTVPVSVNLGDEA